MPAPLLTLKEARQQQRLSLNTLAASAGVHWVTVWRAEHGRSAPLPVVRRSLAQALGYQPDMINWQPPAA